MTSITHDIARRTWRARMSGLLGALVLGLALGVAFGGCAGTSEDAVYPRGDEATLALVGLAVDHHRKADLALAGGDRQAAREEMEALLATCDRYRVGTVEGLDVRYDAAARLARLHLEDDDPASAESAARRGLEGTAGAPPTLFRGYLIQVLADIRERQGDPRGAVELHSEAIEVFRGVLEAQRGGLPPREQQP